VIGLCTIQGCDKPIRQKGLCNMHLLRLAKYGDPLVAFKPRKRDGETRLSSQGYVRARGNVAVHREVAEKKLGRPLLPGEVVHHIDGDRANNAPENLHVFPSQSAHMAHHESLRRQQRKSA
jgi:hypothetical protein